MRLLLDTHIFLWFIEDTDLVPRASLRAIRDPRNQVFLSVASIWEVVIKHQLGKMPLPSPPETLLPQQRERHGIELLLIDEPTLRFLPSLPPLHRDPFDRILICQALEHDLTIVTVDADIQRYAVPTL